MHSDDHEKRLAHDLEVLLARRATTPRPAGLSSWFRRSNPDRVLEQRRLRRNAGGGCRPYLGDGSNGANALALTGIVRSVIRASIVTASAVAEWIQLTVTLTVRSISGCSKLAGYAVHLWHCDGAGDGDYSMYTGAAVNEKLSTRRARTAANGIVRLPRSTPDSAAKSLFCLGNGVDGSGKSHRRLRQIVPRDVLDQVVRGMVKVEVARRILTEVDERNAQLPQRCDIDSAPRWPRVERNTERLQCRR